MGNLLKLMAPDDAAYNDWRLISLSTWPVEAWILCGALALGAVILTWFGLSRLGPGRRLSLGAVRLLAAIVVFVLLLMPALELRAVSKVRARVALLTDVSRSMSLATPSGVTRQEAVAQHLANDRELFERLGREAVIEPALFGEKLRTVESLPTPLPTEDRKSDLARALGDLSFQASGRDLGAVILYSDGADTEGLTVERARELGKNAKVPIYAVGFGSERAVADLAVRRVLGDDFAFLHNSVTLDVELEARGLDLTTTPVLLKKEGAVVASKEATFDAKGRATVSFEFKPTRIGRAAYEVSVPVVPGEVVTGNNARAFVLKVIRDRLRVLQVAGRPSWDERFLRELLKRNPNVDLISFFILRSTTDLQKASQEELALIPFPVNELFTKELGSFDVVIYQNFGYRPYRMEPYLANVAEYVMKGGSFLMIGGSEAFEDGFYANTPVGEILPVRLGGSGAWDPTEYRPRLTPEGRRHPITLIGEAGEPPESVYQRLPPLAGANQSLGLAPGAQALLTHPSLPGNPPVVALREVGEGRTMAVLTDSLWFWRFLAVGEGSAGREFERFWGSSLRWLIRDPELARVRLSLDRAVVPLGEPVRGEAKVLSPDYRGLGQSRVTVELFAGERRNAPAVVSKVLTTGPEGVAPIELGELPAGSYTLRATAMSGLERLGVAEEPLIVEAADLELQSPFPRPEILRALAEASGGRFVDVEQSLGDIEVRDSRRVEVDRTRLIPLWDKSLALGLLVGLLGAEWWFRRRSGLL